MMLENVYYKVIKIVGIYRNEEKVYGARNSFSSNNNL